MFIWSHDFKTIQTWRSYLKVSPSIKKKLVSTGISYWGPSFEMEQLSLCVYFCLFNSKGKLRNPVFSNILNWNVIDFKIELLFLT